MTTTNEVNYKLESLQNELATVEAKANEARAQLEAAATGREPAQAGSIMSGLMVLEARAQGLKLAIEKAESEAQALGEFEKSREYKDGLKKIAELENYFKQEADETYHKLYLLLEHLRAVDAKQREYTQLVDRVCIDLDPAQKNYKAQNKDWRYLMGVYESLYTLEQQLFIVGLVSKDRKQLTHATIM